MQRIDTATAQKDKFGTGKNGFTNGNPQTGVPATDLDSAFFDSTQEEICSVIESTGVELDPGKLDQLLTAIQAIVAGNASVSGALQKAQNLADLEDAAAGRQNLGLGDAATHSADDFLPNTYTPPPAPVSSVNTKTGEVVLTAADVNALPDTYTPPAPDLSAYLTTETANATYQKINTASLSSNGWFKDTNTGLITQWGGVAVSDNIGVNFPIAFPSACTMVTTGNVNEAGTQLDYESLVYAVTTTGFSLEPGSMPFVYWFAVGY